MFEWLQGMFGGGGGGAMGLGAGQALGPQGPMMMPQAPSPQLMFDPANGGSISAMPQMGAPPPPPQGMMPQPTPGFAGVEAGTWGPPQEPPQPPRRPGIGALNSIADQQPQLPGVMDAGTPGPMQAGPLMAYLKQQYGGGGFA